MSNTVDELELKIDKLRDAVPTPEDYSSRMNALIIAREKAQEREFKRSLRRRAQRQKGTP